MDPSSKISASITVFIKDIDNNPPIINLSQEKLEIKENFNQKLEVDLSVEDKDLVSIINVSTNYYLMILFDS